MSQGLVVDGTLAQDSQQAANMWRVREGVSEALVKRGAVQKIKRTRSHIPGSRHLFSWDFLSCSYSVFLVFIFVLSIRNVLLHNVNLVSWC